MKITKKEFKKIIKEEVQKELRRLNERSSISPVRVGDGNNSSRWTPPGKTRKLRAPQLAGYEQLEYPEAEDPVKDFGDEELHIDTGMAAKFNNKVRIDRDEDGNLIFSTPDRTVGGDIQSAD